MSEFLFYLFSFLTLYGALVTVLHKDMVLSAMHLAGSMLALAGLFFLLRAPFLAGVQVVVYAGAVMVLFVMVVMLVDLKKTPKKPFYQLFPLLFHKGWWFRLLSVLFLTGLIAGLFPLSLSVFQPLVAKDIKTTDTKDISHLLFTDYVFIFEVLGVLLLLIAVGVAILFSSKDNNA